MAKTGPRDIGAEILEGIREIKAGEIGRVATFPPAAETRGDPLDSPRSRSPRISEASDFSEPRRGEGM